MLDVIIIGIAGIGEFLRTPKKVENVNYLLATIPTDYKDKKKHRKKKTYWERKYRK